MYLRQTTNELTGEHTCVMLRGMVSDEASITQEWISDFVQGVKASSSKLGTTALTSDMQISENVLLCCCPINSANSPLSLPCPY